MHILIFPSWYSNPLNPMHGSFFRDQAVALKNVGLDVGVIAPQLRSIVTFKKGKLWKYHFQSTSVCNEDGVSTIYSYCWGMRILRGLHVRHWIYQAQRLLDNYISKIGKPDIIHAHGTVWAGICARILAQKYFIPYVITEHWSGFLQGKAPSWCTRYIKDSIDDSSKVIAVSKYLSTYLAGYVGAKQIEIIPNIVNTNFFNQPSIPRRSTKFRILFVGFLDPIKGVDILLRSFAVSFKNQNNVILEIGGDGEPRSYLEDLAGQLGIKSHVHFAGLMSRNKVRQAMWKSNLLVLPSFHETFGVVLIEAMSTGLRVISTRCGGPEEIVTPEVGWLTEPGNIDDLAKILVKAKNQYKPSRKNEAIIRKKVKKNYGEATICDRLISLYNEIVGNRLA